MVQHCPVLFLEGYMFTGSGSHNESQQTVQLVMPEAAEALYFSVAVTRNTSSATKIGGISVSGQLCMWCDCSAETAEL